MTTKRTSGRVDNRGGPVPERTPRDLLAPPANDHGGFGRWALVEIADPWDAKNAITPVTASQL